MTDEQLKWLQELPGNQRGGLYSDEPDKYERTCKCGATVWYNGHDDTLESWVETHFNHEAEKFYKAGSRYDFTKPIKFSEDGFFLFVEEFGLKFVGYVHRKYETFADYITDSGDKFVFRSAEKFRVKPNSLHLILVPEQSKISINA